ncbi:MAG: ABC transporter ATP-binding protein [Pseudomonadota bacterium]
MSLSFCNISHSYGDTEVLRDVDLVTNESEITCLLGPSGSGKSTLLHLAAGLMQVQTGSISIGDKLLASPELNPPPEQRPIGLMFQENALFPNMTVAQNIAFGLDGQEPSDIENRVVMLLEMIGLAGYGSRLPHQLSGGQQQRVTLARSLAPTPRVLLMDEPYANIDVTLRRVLREAARKALRDSGTTTVLVTHDPDEALEMGDRIAVLDQGKIMQLDTPQQIYQQPESAMVAKLFGGAQSLQASMQQDQLHTEYGPITCGRAVRLPSEKQCELVFRPEGLAVAKDDHSQLRISDLRFLGNSWLALLLPENAPTSLSPLRARLELNHELASGDRVSLAARPEGFYCFNLNQE